ncbi:hypothetical protein ACRALDRAFT_213148 [Sodiomyces alcalophilus JCM 7366]|uniref:uncharacterized protein n=1 Tax=Sodiomyces alcalophilus JCM 7366 TaxID=591952 RepID=UPI0039B4762B
MKLWGWKYDEESTGDRETASSLFNPITAQRCWFIPYNRRLFSDGIFVQPNSMDAAWTKLGYELLDLSHSRAHPHLADILVATYVNKPYFVRSKPSQRPSILIPAITSYSVLEAKIGSLGHQELAEDLQKGNPSHLNTHPATLAFCQPPNRRSPRMPPARKRPASSAENPVEAEAPSQSAKRRRASQASLRSNPTTPRARKSSRHQNVFDDDDDDDDIFGDKKTKKGQEQEDDSDVIDLATSDEIPEPQRVPKEDKRIKLNKFQCAICMDSATGLVVTHCGIADYVSAGHMFCSECLQSALDMESTNKKCPICRQKIDHKDRNAYNSKTKGFWHLELKCMTARKLAKQPSHTHDSIQIFQEGENDAAAENIAANCTQ